MRFLLDGVIVDGEADGGPAQPATWIGGPWYGDQYSGGSTVPANPDAANWSITSPLLRVDPGYHTLDWDWGSITDAWDTIWLKGVVRLIMEPDAPSAIGLRGRGLRR